MDEQLSYTKNSFNSDLPESDHYKNFDYKDEAIQLIQFSQDDHSFRANPEAIQFLNSIEPPIAVVAVAGMYRTGKSYLLNRILLNRQDGFGVGSTVNACTKGIWLWGRPVQGQTVDGNPCNVVIVDSEGIGALDEDDNHDNRIFAMAVLFSSYFIYNSVGSIDESSLQNLSLVVNLTKHIHLKSNQETDEEPDYEDYAPYFPSFMWVVRDFTLQLVDENGDSITSKEYLEMALQLQKGFSDAIEEKNRIRKLLKNFFPDRDCSTLVRPSSCEETLQNLAQIELDDLRAEFVTQVLGLRQKILYRVRPKQLNGKNLSGQMLSNLVSSYVEAINQGAVPCIENAWTYICQNECQKALQESELLYENHLLSCIGDSFPVDPKELKRIHIEAKDLALQVFNQKAVGQNKQKFLKQVKQSIRVKYGNVKEDNHAEAKEYFNNFLEQNYSVIQRKIQTKEITSIGDFEQKLSNFQQYFLEHGPQGPQRYENLLEFCVKVSLDAGEMLLYNSDQENSLQQQILQDKVAISEKELAELKQQLNNEIQQLQERATQAESSSMELKIKLDGTEERYQKMKTERESIEEELRTMLKQQTQANNKKAEDANVRIQEYEEKIKELERKIYQDDADKLQTTALLEQKISFLEATLQEKAQKEKDHNHSLNNQKRDHTNYIKEVQGKYENQLKQVNAKLEKEMEKVSELEKQLADRENELESYKLNWEHSEDHLQTRVRDQQMQLELFQQQIKQKDTQIKTEIQKINTQFEQEIQRQKGKLTETESKLRQTMQQINSQTIEWEKEKAVIIQSKEFAEQELHSIKIQLEDERLQHNNMVSAMQNAAANSSQEEFEASLSRLQEHHKTELKQLESEYENFKRESSQKLIDLEQQNAELQLSLKLQNSELSQKVEEMAEELILVKQEKQDLIGRLDDLQNNSSQLDEKTRSVFQQRINELEEQIEKLTQEQTQELAQINQNNENYLSQLKSYYEQEKMRLEQRINEEKERADKRYNLVCEEYDQRLRDEAEQYEEEIQALQEDLHELELQSNEDIQAMQSQAALDAQKIENLEKYIAEIKQNAQESQKSLVANLEEQNARFSKERYALQERIDKLNESYKLRENEVNSLQYSKQQLEKNALNKDKEFQEYKEQYQQEKEVIQQRLEKAKETNQTLADELSQKKSDFKRELALANQHIEFQVKKIQDLESSLQDSNKRYTDGIKQAKEEYNQELNEAINKLTLEKENLEAKLDTKKQELRNSQLTTTREINQLEKEKALMTEKFSQLEQKKQDIEHKYKEELEQMQQLLKEQDSASGIDVAQLQQDNEKLQHQNSEMERQLSEVSGLYERDKTLWENKCNFLTQQRDQAKQDLADAQGKFDQTIEQLQKRGMVDKDKLEATTNSLISSIEARYTSQIQDIQESHQSAISEASSRLKSLEAELRNTKENLEIEKRNRNNDLLNGEKRMKDLQDIETRYSNEISQLRKQKEDLMSQLNDTFNSEKEGLRAKLSDLEKRAKEAEQAKGSLFLEHEKERAKWALERDHLISQKNEAQDMIERLEKRKESLLRENEKLRSDRTSRTRVGVQKRDIPNPIRGMLPTSNVSFEEFSKDRNNENSGTITPNSNVTGDTESSPKPLRQKNFSVIRAASPLVRSRVGSRMSIEKRENK